MPLPSANKGEAVYLRGHSQSAHSLFDAGDLGPSLSQVASASTVDRGEARPG